MTSIRIGTWGTAGLGTITVRVRDGEPIMDAVQRSVARRTGYAVVTCRSDGTELDCGRPVAQHHQMTLGSPVPRRLGGGWNVEGEIWVSVPID